MNARAWVIFPSHLSCHVSPFAVLLISLISFLRVQNPCLHHSSKASSSSFHSMCLNTLGPLLFFYFSFWLLKSFIMWSLPSFLFPGCQHIWALKHYFCSSGFYTIMWLTSLTLSFYTCGIISFCRDIPKKWPPNSGNYCHEYHYKCILL